ncbi:helix-turn-helix DNA binding domain protein [Mycobacterium phage Arbiter]|uniref:Helix-turn-helix DNA binding domain protein n=3 Tax=Rosebushvirus TaxID=1982900 RepID=Q19Z45_9CAUD|nr:DNA binding protein [Mycobacterium phage Rosebush]YP_655721.1 DNA binding protein [Mycobacterium phage Qyrzula]AAN01885.1 helix-turn-helix DNA binding domain protein [Mycobacterium phage Rosebush]ABE67461.1 helix-turn-helix DNA binding domain protein [Mycobacterium phage Qyrzula]AEN79589.1 helix-turn-helix DNA binding domain protein [Mycobacterium phage Arbiter]
MVYLSRAEVAARLGLGPRSLSRIKLPTPDAVIGPYKGWFPDTIDEWAANRPGRGNWGAR